MRALALVCAAATGAIAAAMLGGGCSSPAAEVQFAGREHPPASQPSDIELLGGSRPPDGYRVIGVVTARCATLNGTSGVLASGPCNEGAMTAMLRDKAAAVGGDALLDPECSDNVLERQLESRDGGGLETSVRALVSCQATVARRTGRAGKNADRAAEPSKRRGGERVEIGDASVDVHFDPSASSASAGARDEVAVGELDSFPRGYVRLGDLTAECLTACSRAAARTALKRRAAKAGALAVADIRCEILGQRWRCQASAVGDAIEVDAAVRAPVTSEERDAGAPTPSTSQERDADAGHRGGSDGGRG